MEPNPDAAGVIRLLDIRETPLSVDEVLAAIGSADAGGLCVFIGTVRDHDDGQGVTGLGYSAHPQVRAILREVAEEVGAKHQITALAAVHRVGDLVVGDRAVVAAAAAGHRAEAFAACRALIDEIKARVPIWKHQRFSDGTDEWVGIA